MGDYLPANKGEIDMGSEHAPDPVFPQGDEPCQSVVMRPHAAPNRSKSQP